MSAENPPSEHSAVPMIARCVARQHPPRPQPPLESSESGTEESWSWAVLAGGVTVLAIATWAIALALIGE